MATPIVANTIAPVEYTLLTDVSGAYSLLMPSVQVAQLRSLGHVELPLVLNLYPGRSNALKVLGFTEIARKLMERFRWLTIDAAKGRVSRALASGALPSIGPKGRRLVRASDCDTWLASELIRDVDRE